MKFLLLLAVLVVVGLLFFGRRRPPPAVPPGKPASRKADGPEPMLQCAHCGVHLPQADALMDAGGRPYCSDAHRLQGPR